MGRDSAWSAVRSGAWCVAPVVAAWLGGGCAGSIDANLHDPDPAVRIPAIVAADGTADELRGLVSSLEHADAAVRVFAIESLARQTGETLGYRAYDPPAARASAVERWRRWLSSAEGSVLVDRGAGAEEPRR